MPDKLKEMQDLFYAEAAKYDVLPLDNSTLARWNAPRPSLTGGRTAVHLLRRPQRRSRQRRAEHPGQVPTHHRRGRDPRGRRGGHDRHRWRTLRRLRPVPEQGRVRRRPRQGRSSSTTCSISSAPPGKARSWSPASTRIVFDFKSDGPGLGQGRDRRPVGRRQGSRHATPWSTPRPITFPEDETFDVGLRHPHRRWRWSNTATTARSSSPARSTS